MYRPNKISAILFDFDGVLIDSLPAMRKAWESVTRQYTLDISFEKYKSNIGIPFSSILSNLEINSELHKPIKSHYSLVASESKELIKLNPYVRFLLKWVNNNSIESAIVTSKDLVRTHELLEFFQLDFHLVVTPELTKRGKPFPDPILYAAKTLSLELDEILFIGDMAADMNCAQNAKCLYLHYLDGYQKLSNQIYGGEISSLKDVVEYITYIH